MQIVNYIVNFNVKDTTWTQAMKEHAEKVIEKAFARINIPLESSFTVKTSIIDKKTKMIKVELSGAGFRAQSVNKDFYTAMTAVANKFKSLVVKQNKKYITKKKHISFDDNSFLKDVFEAEALISKEKVFIIDSCTVEAAITKFEQTDYSFYIFKDIDSSDEVAVLYRRADDTFGIIRCR